MIERDKKVLAKLFVDEAVGEALKLGMLEHFPSLEAKTIVAGVDSMRREVLGLTPKQKQKAIQ